jgi:hypothetical protein
MKPFITHTGLVLPLDRINVDVTAMAGQFVDVREFALESVE